MIVTRSASKRNLGSELLEQLTQQPAALVLTGVFLFVLMLTPLPKVPLIGLAIATITIGYIVNGKRRTAATERVQRAKAKAKPSERVEELLLPDPMELEVGYGLIRLVDRKQEGDLLDLIANMRRQIAQELGILVPPVRIRDHLKLEPNHYRIKIKGLDIASGEILPGHLLAIDPGTVTEKVHGTETTEPAFGLPALWVLEEQRYDAEQRNYTVVEASSVLSTHLTETIKRHANELLTRQEVDRLLDTLKERSPKLVAELVPEVVKPGEIQKVLQALLRERVPIRDLETIVETIGDWAPRTKDADVLVEYVRAALARTICHQYRGPDGKILCVTLDPTIEEAFVSHIEQTERGAVSTLPPRLQRKILEALTAEVERAVPGLKGQTPVVLCAPRIRAWIRRMIEPVMPHVGVVSFNEIVRGVEIESRGMVTLPEE